LTSAQCVDVVLASLLEIDFRPSERIWILDFIPREFIIERYILEMLLFTCSEG